MLEFENVSKSFWTGSQRKVILEEMMRVMEAEDRSILFSSHNTLDVEQISDHIAFINQGRIVASDDKETFLDSWRRLRLVVEDGYVVPDLPGVIDANQAGHQIVLTLSGYSDSVQEKLKASGASVSEIQRLTLEDAGAEPGERALRYLQAQRRSRTPGEGGRESAVYT